MRVLGVIIAGGTSSRMGQEKAFVELAGVALIARVMSRIRFQVDEIVINANGDLGRFSHLGVDAIADRITHMGTPLAGLHAALAHAQHHGFDAVLTVASDQPFLPLDLVEKLEEAGRETGAAVGASGGQIHYLTGLWSAALAPELEKQMIHGMVRAQDFVHHVSTATVDWETVPHDPFLNVNTIQDLEVAAGIAKG
jgi:molybdenum cofactor guanylyltransferase